MPTRAAAPPGAPCWIDLTTFELDRAQDFTDEFRYTTAWFVDQQLLGVMDGASWLPEGVASNWAIFFGAEDVDETLRVIGDNGGAVVRAAEDTPYGRLAAASDPTGVVFNLSSLQP